MPRLAEIIPDFELVLAMEPEELAGPLLITSRNHVQNGLVNLGNLTRHSVQRYAVRSPPTVKLNLMGSAGCETISGLC
jgi:hypothetical protein